MEASVAHVTDLFLVYISAAFAMLGSCAMFFVIDVLGKLFSSTMGQQMRATMLSVFYLEVSGLTFAVDSVRAALAQVSVFFLAYTSAVFAVLGLHAMFFIDFLGKLFSSLGTEAGDDAVHLQPPGQQPLSAVDSVMATVAQVFDLFLVYTPKSLRDAQFPRHVLIHVLGKLFCTLMYQSLTTSSPSSTARSAACSSL